MKDLFNRDEIEIFIAQYKRFYDEDCAYLHDYNVSDLVSAGVDLTSKDVTEGEIDKYIDFYSKRVMKKISRKQFVKELVAYRDYFKKHNNQGGLDVVNKLINDRKIYDKCVKITDGSFFETRILFLPHRTHMLQVCGDIKEGTSWKDVINQLYRNYEFIPCHWNSYDSVFDLDTDIIGGEIFDYYKMGMKT
jgi:hypothetical protein